MKKSNNDFVGKIKRTSNGRYDVRLEQNGLNTVYNGIPTVKYDLNTVKNGIKYLRSLGFKGKIFYETN